MEHKFVEMAKVMLIESGRQNKEVYKQVHSKDNATNQSGMICSGEQTIFLHEINGNDLPSVEKIIKAEKTNMGGTLSLTKNGIQFSDDNLDKDFSLEIRDDEFLLKEKIGYKNILHIIGGGHCALALSQLMGQMDFYIHVYDDRKDLATMRKNSFAHELHVLESFNELGPLIEEKNNVFVVIMTFGYRTDDLALRALLHKKFTYLGVMGSRKKIEQMFGAYREEGVHEETIQRLHAPVGLQIKSETPAEIAVSIAAEIIKVKNLKP